MHESPWRPAEFWNQPSDEDSQQAMNAALTLCSIVHYPIFRKERFSPPLICFRRPSKRRRNLSSQIPSKSLVIETAGTQVLSEEDEKKQEDESQSGSESVAPRRLILLRHAKSSWADRSLRGAYLSTYSSNK